MINSRRALALLLLLIGSTLHPVFAGISASSVTYLPLVMAGESTNTTPTISPTDPTTTVTATPVTATPVTATPVTATPVTATPVTPTPVTPTPKVVIDWRTALNTYRSWANLPQVTENTSWSDGGVKHAKYMVKNDVIAHSEDSSKPYYTAEGNLAAQNGNVAVDSRANTLAAEFIKRWMVGPFHGIGMLDPRLTTSGFGAYNEADGGWQSGATLDVIRGRSNTVPAGITYPIMWPADGKTSTITSYDGGEFPDPLSGCAGYNTNLSGAPIYLQLGSGSVTPSVTAFSLKENGASVSVCEFDETNFSYASDPASQQLGRQILAGRDAIVLMPKNPLVVGATYTVSITANGNTYTWSFNVAAPS